MLVTLWGVGEAEARRVARGLADRSLAKWEWGGIRLHDLQLDYVRELFADRETLGLIHRAARLCAHVMEKKTSQFASQMVGRLLGYSERPAIQQFVDEVSAGASRPWVRPLRAALDPPSTPLLRILQAHSSSVYGVAVTPDGKPAVSASGDKTLIVWDLASGLLITTFYCDASARCCAFADRQRIVAGDTGGRVYILSLEESGTPGPCENPPA